MEREKTVAARSFQRLKDYMNANIVGQADLVDKLLVALLADGHLLVEGAPGLAKTKAIKKLSEAIEGDDQRIQFTPDLLPSDITGSDIYRPETGDFKFQAGPIFHNLILADEINRAPAKVQSALLEAMAERHYSSKKAAARHPIEQEGTYPLPEAQLDRFLMYVKIDQPDAAAERRILQIVRNEALEEGAEIPVEVMPQQRVFEARREVLNVHLSPALEEYVIQLVMATRKPEKYGEKFKRLVAFGASPRGTIALDRCARAKAWLAGRDFVLPEDVHGIVHDVLRHRVILTFEAEAEGITPDSFLDLLLKRVPLP